MFDACEIGSVKVIGKEIHFGEITMFRYGSAHRLPWFVNDTAYKTSLGSVLGFENYDKGFFGKIKKYLRDEICVGVPVNDNVVFRRDRENVVIKWTGKKCLCETENKSTLKSEEYEKLKDLAMAMCAK